MTSIAVDFPISDNSGLKCELTVPECPAESPPARPKVACPGCGKLLAIKVLSEKHHCERKPRTPWKMEPEQLLERRKAAAIRRFEKRTALRQSSVELGEPVVV